MQCLPNSLCLLLFPSLCLGVGCREHMSSLALVVHGNRPRLRRLLNLQRVKETVREA
jgi:hypothetical protein